MTDNNMNVVETPPLQQPAVISATNTQPPLQQPEVNPRLFDLLDENTNNANIIVNEYDTNTNTDTNTDTSEITGGATPEEKAEIKKAEQEFNEARKKLDNYKQLNPTIAKIYKQYDAEIDADKKQQIYDENKDGIEAFKPLFIDYMEKSKTVGLLYKSLGIFSSFFTNVLNLINNTASSLTGTTQVNNQLNDNNNNCKKYIFGVIHYGGQFIGMFPHDFTVDANLHLTEPLLKDALLQNKKDATTGQDIPNQYKIENSNETGVAYPALLQKTLNADNKSCSIVQIMEGNINQIVDTYIKNVGETGKQIFKPFGLNAGNLGDGAAAAASVVVPAVGTGSASGSTSFIGTGDATAEIDRLKAEIVRLEAYKPPAANETASVSEEIARLKKDNDELKEKLKFVQLETTQKVISYFNRLPDEDANILKTILKNEENYNSVINKIKEFVNKLLKQQTTTSFQTASNNPPPPPPPTRVGGKFTMKNKHNNYQKRKTYKR